MSYRSYRKKSNVGPYLLGLLLISPFLIFCSLNFYLGIDYNRSIAGFLKRAADANTIEIAKKELNVALVEIERREWTSGSTDVLWTTPRNDVGFWYENIKASAEELQQMSPNATPLERTNVLMKLRESILDDSESASVVTAPSGISKFPNNKAYAVFGLVSTLFGLVGVLIIVVKYEEY